MRKITKPCCPSRTNLLAGSLHLNLRTLMPELLAAKNGGDGARLQSGHEELCVAVTEALSVQESLGNLL